MKIKKNSVYAGIFIAAVLIIGTFYYTNYYKKNQKSPLAADKKAANDSIAWMVDTNGYIYYPLSRGNVKFNRQDYAETKNLLMSRIIYQSKNGNIYGLLIMPKNVTELLPGIVLLPGAGVSKESELNLAKNMAELGAFVLVIDQRGVGETTAPINSIKQDYIDFINAREPSQHLMVYDALRGFDLLRSAPFIDPDRIIIMGESLGGGIAIIAAAIDRNVHGVLVISSSGFDFAETNDTKINVFLKSIDADHYIGLVTPRKLVMMHNSYDKIIPLEAAIRTYSKAQEPKQFALVNDTSCNHGYCDSMYSGLIEALDYLVNIKSRTLVSIPDKLK